MRFYPGTAGILFFCFVCTAPAQVIDSDAVVSAVTDTLTDVTDSFLSDIHNARIGLGPVASPDYDGSDDYKLSIKPLLTLRYRDVVQIDNNRLRVFVVGSELMVPSEKFKAGPLLKIGSGRDESGNTDLAGLGEVGNSIELGVFASYETGPAQLRLRLQQDIANGHSGMMIIGDVQVGFYRTDKMTIIGSISLTWANENYMESSFGVNGAQSVASGLPVFNAGSGLKDIRGGFGANYNISEYWSILGFAGYARSLGDANDSPIVTLRGSANQVA
ncbi:MAG: MipA/OmpV family protein, partial [Gammaproteobacteria bacterium]